MATAVVVPAEAEDALKRVTGQTAAVPDSDDDSDIEILSQPVRERQQRTTLDATVGSRAAVADDIRCAGKGKSGKDKGKGKAVTAQQTIELDDTDDEAASRPGSGSAASFILANASSPTRSTRTDDAVTHLHDGLETDADADAAYARQLFEAINGNAYADGPLLDGAIARNPTVTHPALPSTSALASFSALRSLPTLPAGNTAAAFTSRDGERPSAVPLPGAFPQQVDDPVEDDATLAARFAAEEEAEWENEKARRADQEKADELYARVTQQNEELAEKRVRQTEAKKALRKKQRLSGAGPSSGHAARGDSEDSEEESKIAFQVTMDADGKTIEGDEDADNLAHLELVKNDFQQAGVGVHGLKIKRVTYFVNFELNKRFEAAKDALARQGRDATERTLFHGTADANVQPILENGFHIGGVAGARVVNGTACGLGVYLAHSPMTSWAYCAGGNRMFACRVVTGLATPMAQHQPPSMPGQNTFDAYESGGVVVARHAHQVLPKYLVEFEGGTAGNMAIPRPGNFNAALAGRLNTIPGFMGATITAQVAGGSRGGGLGAVSLPGGWSPYANQAPAKKRKRK